MPDSTRLVAVDGGWRRDSTTAGGEWLNGCSATGMSSVVSRLVLREGGVRGKLHARVCASSSQRQLCPPPAVGLTLPKPPRLPPLLTSAR